MMSRSTVLKAIGFAPSLLLTSMIALVLGCGQSSSSSVSNEKPTPQTSDTFSLAINKTTITLGDSFNVSIHLSAPSTADHPFTWSVLSPGTSFTSSSGTAVIANGGQNISFNLTTINDQIYHPDHVYTLRVIDSLPPYSSSDIRFSLTSVTPQPFVSIADANGNRGAFLNFVVSLSSPSGQDVTFEWNTLDQTALAGTDYTGARGLGRIPAGSTSTTIRITTLSSSASHTNKTMALALTNITGARTGDLTGTGTILAGTTLSTTVAFASSGGTVQETDGHQEIPLILSSSSPLDVYVDYTVGGNIRPGSYAGLQSGRLTIPAGATSASIPVDLIRDHLFTNTQTLVVHLASSINCGIASTSTYTMNITNVDPQPTLSIGDATATVGDNLQFTVSLDVASGADTQFSFSTANISAASTRYHDQIGTLTIPAGQTVATITIPTFDDHLYQNTGSIGVSLMEASNATVLRGLGTGVILERNAPPVVQFATAAQSVSVSAKQVTVKIQLSQASGVNAKIPFTVGGTAQVGIDHNLGAGTITILAGQTSVDLTFNVFTNTTNPSVKTIDITLGSPSDATLGATKFHEVTLNP